MNPAYDELHEVLGSGRSFKKPMGGKDKSGMKEPASGKRQTVPPGMGRSMMAKLGGSPDPLSSALGSGPKRTSVTPPRF